MKKKNEEDFSKVLSWWTPGRKIVAYLITAGVIGGIGLTVHDCNQEYHRRAGYAEHVNRTTAPHRRLGPHTEPVKRCLTHGAEARVYNDTIMLYATEAKTSTFTVSNGSKSNTGLCIRLVDGGQDVDLESKILISGVEHGDFTGLARYDARLNLVPDIPDVFAPDIDINSISVNGKAIPLSYLEHRDDEEQYFSLDIGRLVRDDILDDDDFNNDLDVNIRTSIGLDSISTIDHDDIADFMAFNNMPQHFRQFTKGTEHFKPAHPRITDMIDAYSGSKSDVHEMLRYALDTTTEALEYCKTDNSNCTKGRYLPIPEILDQGGGVCVGYTNVFVSMARAFGIPARDARGTTVNREGTKISGRHAWAEVLLPLKDGSYRWIAVDPTWADNDSNPDRYINFSTPKYLYDIGFQAHLESDRRFGRYNIFQENSWKSKARSEPESISYSSRRMEFEPIHIDVLLGGDDEDR